MPSDRLGCRFQSVLRTNEDVFPGKFLTGYASEGWETNGICLIYLVFFAGEDVTAGASEGWETNGTGCQHDVGARMWGGA